MIGFCLIAQNNPLIISGNPLRITVYDDNTMAVERYQENVSDFVHQYYGEVAKGSVIFLNGTATLNQIHGPLSLLMMQALLACALPKRFAMSMATIFINLPGQSTTAVAQLSMICDTYTEAILPLEAMTVPKVFGMPQPRWYL
jgi:uncharacterized membrane protein